VSDIGKNRDHQVNTWGHQDVVACLFGKGRGYARLKELRTKLRESLDATEVKAFKRKVPIYALDGNCFTREEFVYSKPLVAHRIRLQALKVCFELLRAFPSTKR
jgi:hypothetical protein